LVNNNDVTVTDEVESRLQYLFGDSDEFPDSVENAAGSVKSPVKELEGVSVVVRDSDEKGQLTAAEPADSPEPVEDADFLDDSATLEYLKSVVLSIDWEIDDASMERLVEETERLKETYEYDRTLVILFQLLGSVGKYIKTNKAAAHRDSISLLNSIYSTLEKIILSKGMTEAERKKELFAQVNKFKQLKEQIRLTKKGAAEKKEVLSPGIPAPLTADRVKDADLQKERRLGEEAIEEKVQSAVSHMLPHEAFAFALEEIKEVIKAEFKALRAELKLWRDSH
jgi:hypothetical protein